MRTRQLFGDDLTLEQHGIHSVPNFTFLNIAKEIWAITRDTYNIKKNTSQVFEVYEDLFSFRQGNKSLKDYYSYFKGMIDELNQYHLVTNDLEVLESSVKNYMFVSFFRGSVLNSNNFEDNY